MTYIAYSLVCSKVCSDLNRLLVKKFFKIFAPQYALPLVAHQHSTTSALVYLPLPLVAVATVKPKPILLVVVEHSVILRSRAFITYEISHLG